MSQKDRRVAICVYLRGLVDLKRRDLRHGAISDAAQHFHASRKCIRGVWKANKQAILDPEQRKIDISRKKGSGRLRKFTVQQVQEKVKRVPLSQRQTVRALAARLNIPRTSLHRLLKEGTLVKHRSAIKSILTEANKRARVQYAEDHVDGNLCFKLTTNSVMVDEKWWFLSRVAVSYIIVPGESVPAQKCKHKKHITKIITLIVNAGPRQNPEMGNRWDGKIGI